VVGLKINPKPNNHTAIEELKKENQELKGKLSEVENEIAEKKKIMEKLL